MCPHSIPRNASKGLVPVVNRLILDTIVLVYQPSALTAVISIVASLNVSQLPYEYRLPSGMHLTSLRARSRLNISSLLHWCAPYKQNTLSRLLKFWTEKNRKKENYGLTHWINKGIGKTLIIPQHKLRLDNKDKIIVVELNSKWSPLLNVTFACLARPIDSRNE